MTSAASERAPRSSRTRAVALVAMTSLACATVRVPAASIPPAVTIRGDVAEPQVELWVESGEDVSPAEAAHALAESRAALEQALASRSLAQGEQLLVVRAQGVSRTGSRRADQTAAVAGLVVAAIAVVAVVVVVAVASAGKGGGGGKAPRAIPAPPASARPAPPPGVVAAGAAAVPVPRPAPPPIAAPLPAPGRPSAGGHARGGVVVAVGADVQVPFPAPDGPPPAVWSDSVVTAPPPPPAPGEVAEIALPPLAPSDVTEIVLPPPPRFEVGRRGFFARDATRLELTLVDRDTGRPLWVKVVESEADPRDARAVRALLDRGLDDPAGWQPATPSS